MSNLIGGGKEIHAEDDYQIRYYSKGPLAGHVVQWNRQYQDGHPLPTWASTDFGEPSDATRSLPGLAFLIRKAAEE